MDSGKRERTSGNASAEGASQSSASQSSASQSRASQSRAGQGGTEKNATGSSLQTKPSTSDGINVGRDCPFFDTQLAERLSAMPLVSRGAMLGSVSGRHQSPHRGSSVEFAEYRRYQPGDDLRRLDWRAYGRTDRYYVKEFEADTNLRLVSVVDQSGSMAFGDKLQASRRISAMLSYLAIGQGDAAGLMVASESGAEFIPPRRIAGQVSVLFEHLSAMDPSGPTTLGDSLHELAERIRERALVVVISDLLFEPSQLRNAVEHLVFRKHDVVLFHLLDPLELQPDWNRPVRLEDMESDEVLLVDPDQVSEGYEAAVRQYIDDIEDLARETGVDYQRVMLDQSIDQALMEFVARRRGEQVR